jgi:hypothetical protein
MRYANLLGRLSGVRSLTPALIAGAARNSKLMSSLKVRLGFGGWTADFGALQRSQAAVFFAS